MAGFCLLLFWLLAGAVWAPTIERALQSQVSVLLADHPTSYSPVKVLFDGQRARLTGKVRHADQAESAFAKLSQQGRGKTPFWPFATGLNPITAISNDLETQPYPAGWLMVAANGNRAQLLGKLASEYEARDVSLALQERWAKTGARLETRVKTSPERFDEAAVPGLTLQQIPEPRLGGGGDSAQVHVARLGGPWQRLTLDAPDADLLRQASLLGVSGEDWETLVHPALLSVRRYQQAERIRLAEAERQAKLPPPHVFLAARDGRLLVRGEVASLKLKRELLNALIGEFPTWKVLDDLRVNPQRRAVAEFGPITTALLPQGKEPGNEKSLALGLSDAAWQFVDWQVGGDAQPWREFLPKDLPTVLLQEDSRMVTEWLQGNPLGIPTLAIPAQPSFLTLTLLPDKVILAGQLAEEGWRTQLIEAARRAYAGRAILMSEALLARGTCEPTTDVEQTIRSLPALPSAGESAVLAFVRPGQVWKSKPAQPTLLAPGGLSASGLLPTDFPAAMAEDTFADAFDHVRHYWKNNPPEVKGTSTP